MIISRWLLTLQYVCGGCGPPRTLAGHSHAISPVEPQELLASVAPRGGPGRCSLADQLVRCRQAAGLTGPRGHQHPGIRCWRKLPAGSPQGRQHRRGVGLDPTSTAFENREPMGPRTGHMAGDRRQACGAGRGRPPRRIIVLVAPVASRSPCGRHCSIASRNSTRRSLARDRRSSRRTEQTSGSLLIRDVDVQAAACRDRVDQGLQLRRRGRFGPCLPPALQRGPGGEPGAY